MRKTLVAVVLSLMTVTAAWGEDREVCRKAAEVEVALDPLRKEGLESDAEVVQTSVLESTLDVEATSIKRAEDHKKADTETICNSGIQALSCGVVFLLLIAFLYGLL